MAKPLRFLAYDRTSRAPDNPGHILMTDWEQHIWPSYFAIKSVHMILTTSIRIWDMRSLLHSQVSASAGISLELGLVLATGPNSRFDSRSGSNPEPDRCNRFPPKTRHFKSPILAPIKYLSSDRILTWSVHRLCSFSPSFPSRSQICDPTSIRWVAIENPHFSAEISPYFTAIQRILAQSQI